MKNLLNATKLLLILVVVTFSITSCRKSTITEDTQPELAVAENLSIAEIEDDNVQIMADQAESTGSTSGLRVTSSNSTDDILGDCPVVTRDSLSTPKKTIIDFGTGCTGPNGVVRKGKIIITYTGRYRDAGTIVHIISENYYVNENKLDIDRTVKNQGVNDFGHFVFYIHSIRKVTFPDGTFSSSDVNKIRTWVEGYNTPRDFSDDIYKVMVDGTHTSKNEIIYDISTIKALIRNVSCHQYTSGILKIVRQGQIDGHAILNYGDGDCDNEATVTFPNGSVITIQLRH